MPKFGEGVVGSWGQGTPERVAEMGGFFRRGGAGFLGFLGFLG